MNLTRIHTLEVTRMTWPIVGSSLRLVSQAGATDREDRVLGWSHARSLSPFSLGKEAAAARSARTRLTPLLPCRLLPRSRAAAASLW